MKIAIIGAHGLVGKPVSQEAARRGHEVIEYTRSGADTTTALDLGDTQAVASAIDHADATVISVASRDNYDAAITAHKALVEAAPRGRFLVIGGAGALQAGDQLLLETPGFPEEYLAEARTFAEVHRLYEESEGLQWSMIAPSPVIAPGVRTGAYVVELDVPAGTFVSAEDFAVAIVDELEQARHAGQRFTVASADAAAAQA